MPGPHVGLFVTCLVDAMRPRIGFAAIKLLEAAGCRVVVPEAQTCCGQPAFNSGDDGAAARLARQVIDAFEGLDYLVAPSGSCAGMIKKHFPQLLAEDAAYASRAEELSRRTYEIMSFLKDVLSFEPQPPGLHGKAVYHDSCSGLRELEIFDQPRSLLNGVAGLEITELSGRDQCCGFGGTFCVKFPEISAAIAHEKVKAIEASGADYLLAGDLGCLLNIAGTLSRQNLPVRCYHAIEVLCGGLDDGIVPVNDKRSTIN